MHGTHPGMFFADDVAPDAKCNFELAQHEID
jgi:hypothetical protein